MSGSRIDKGIDKVDKGVDRGVDKGDGPFCHPFDASGSLPQVTKRTVPPVNSAPLDALRAELGTCQRCQLSETRTNVVFGVGNPQAEVMFIGEAPGKNEDLGAEPFIGAAGQYLNSLLALAGLERKEIYIANVLKCRPPENRDPRPDEIEICTPFLREQVRLINPHILVTLGNFATRFILKTDRGITGLRGQVHITGRFSVLPIFHPAAAIYDRAKGPIMEEDFKLLGRLIARRREERNKRKAAEGGRLDEDERKDEGTDLESSPREPEVPEPTPQGAVEDEEA